MTTVYGIPSTDLPRMLKRVVDDGNIRVIDPIYLFRSKWHCLHGLDQSDRQDARHVRMLALILPEYLSFLRKIPLFDLREKTIGYGPTKEKWEAWNPDPQ